MTKADKPAVRSAEGQTTGYRLDARDRIIEVSGEWDRFACDNGAEELAMDSVIGVPLRSFISGDVTRMFIDTMHARVRMSGRPMIIPYRCDSPGVKRFMEMSLAAIGTDLVSEHRLLSEHVMPRALVFRSASDGRPQAWTKRCSMCNRLAMPDGRLVEPDQFAETKRADGQAVGVIYFVCPECKIKIQARFAK
jgi:hypothetical protein